MGNEEKTVKLGRPFKIPGEKDTKEKIIEAAVDLFSASGYIGTSIRQIAKAVGLTEGAVYRHFPGKEEILNTIFTLAEKYIYTPLPIEENLGEDPRNSIFRGLLGPLPEVIGANPMVIKIMRIIYIELGHNDKIRQFFQTEFVKRANDYIEQLFTKCMEKGTISSCDPRALAIVFNSYRSDWAFRTYMLNNDVQDFEDAREELETMIKFFEQYFTPYK